MDFVHPTPGVSVFVTEPRPRALGPPGPPDTAPSVHSTYLQGYLLEVASRPADHRPQSEDGAVGVLGAKLTGLQEGSVLGVQHIGPGGHEHIVT